MNDADGFRLEAAEQFGFEEIDGQDGPGQPGYFCTESELIAFAKACERKGLAEAQALSKRVAVWNRIDEIDAELAPILAAEEARFMTSRGYVRATEDQPGARWIKPESKNPTAEDLR